MMGKVIMSGIVPPLVAPVTYKANFADNTWAQIIDACHKNQVPDTWVVGSQKTMTIGGTAYAIDIIGKNHDAYASGGKAPLTFQMHDCYEQDIPMNFSATAIDDWTNCAMRQNFLPALLSAMPTEVQNGIREVNKLTSSGSGSATINTTADKLFLLSEIEIFGSVTYSVSGEGTQYDYYKAGNSTVKKYNGRAQTWWERSPDGGLGGRFCIVTSTGDASSIPSADSNSVVFGFCF